MNRLGAQPIGRVAETMDGARDDATLSATLDRKLWQIFGDVIHAPWLTRDNAEIYLHTEWAADAATTPAA